MRGGLQHLLLIVTLALVTGMVIMFKSECLVSVMQYTLLPITMLNVKLLVSVLYLSDFMVCTSFTFMLGWLYVLEEGAPGKCCESRPYLYFCS